MTSTILTVKLHSCNLKARTSVDVRAIYFFFLHMFGFCFGFRRSKLERSNAFKITRTTGIMSHQNFSLARAIWKDGHALIILSSFPARMATPAMAIRAATLLDKPALLPLLAFLTLFIHQAFTPAFTYLASHGHCKDCSLFLGIMGVFGHGVDWCSRERFLYLRSVYTNFCDYAFRSSRTLRIIISSSVPRIFVVLLACLQFICGSGFDCCKPRLLAPRATSADFTLVRSSCLHHHLRHHVPGQQDQCIKLPWHFIACQCKASHHES
jgi:hypothetical protein